MIRFVLALACYLAVGAQAAVVSFDPSSKIVNKNDVFLITITGSGFASNLDGGGLNLSFNASVLEVQDVILDPTWDFFVDKGTIDNSAGTVLNIQFNQFVHPKVGSFDIGAIQFRAKDIGSSVLHLTEGDNPFGSGGDPVTVQFLDGSVEVVPEPGAVWLLAAGLTLLTLIWRLSPAAAT